MLSGDVAMLCRRTCSLWPLCLSSDAKATSSVPACSDGSNWLTPLWVVSSRDQGLAHIRLSASQLPATLPANRLKPDDSHHSRPVPNHYAGGGISGEVNKVFIADNATLEFAHLRQPSEGVMALILNT